VGGKGNEKTYLSIVYETARKTDLILTLLVEL
jgi:hypothetical protein